MYIDDRFLDKYCGLIDPVYIVGYLWIKRNYKPMLLMHECCYELHIQASTFRKILQFWTEQEVLHYNIDDKNNKVFIRFGANPHKENPEKSVSDTKAALNNPEFVKIIASIEIEFPVRLTDYPKIAYVWKELGYKEDMFDVLIEYAKGHNAKYATYLVTMANKMYDAGVENPTAARAWINGDWKKLVQWKKKISSVPPVPAEIDMYYKWKAKEYTDEMILKAFSITARNNIPNPSFNYVEGVLKNLAIDVKSSGSP